MTDLATAAPSHQNLIDLGTDPLAGVAYGNDWPDAASPAAAASRSAGFDPYDGGLTPDALLVYLSSRLGGLEDQINAYFAEQQRADKLRSLLNEMKSAISRLNPHVEDMNELRQDSAGAVDTVYAKLAEIEAIDADLARKLEANLEADGYILTGEDDEYRAAQIEPSIEYLDNAISDLNSASQINMIRLQSLVRAHETAVSLGTNLVEAAGRTTQKIADRIGG